MIDFYLRAMKKLDKLDVAQRKELLISAVQEISLLDTVLHSMGIGILVCDEKNNLVRANKFAKRLLHINTTGTGLYSAVKDPKIAGFFTDILNSREKVIGCELDLVHSGISMLISVNVLPLVQDKRITGSIIYLEDITEKRKELERLRRAENLASLTTLAASVAHEIKNPLASISIHLQLFEKRINKKCKKLGITAEKYFSVIKEEINRLNRIVVDFLFAVRPLTLELRESDINTIISKLIDFVSLEMERSNIKCVLELGEDMPKILLDERYMKQSLLNLIKNAQAAMPKGGILTVSTSRIDNEIKIKVSDTGTGIKKEDFSKIFEPYFTTKKTGTGLGLTVVYKIIKEHRGEITVNSKQGKGTVFEIALPVPQKEMRMIAYSGINEGDV